MGKSEYALSDNDRELYRPFSVVRQLSPASATALEFFSPLGAVFLIGSYKLTLGIFMFESSGALTNIH